MFNISIREYTDICGMGNFVMPVTSSKDGNRPCSRKEQTRVKRKRSSELKTNINKVPVIVETYKQNRVFPFIQKFKFMVPVHMLASQFADVIRVQMKLPSHQSFNLMLKDRRIPATLNMGLIHKQHKNEDGLLCTTIVDENTFGCPTPRINPVQPEFDDLDQIFPDDPVEFAPQSPEVIYLTAVLSHPDHPPSETQLQSLPPSIETEDAAPVAVNNSPEHLQSVEILVDQIANAILAAVASPSVQSIMLQSYPGETISLTPQSIKDALLNYIQIHNLSPSLDIKNFNATIKIITPDED